MPIEIDPCPKCGEQCRLDSIPPTEGHFPEFFVACTQCRYVSPHALFKDRAIRRHNQQGETAQQEDDHVEPCKHVNEQLARQECDRALIGLDYHYSFDGEGNLMEDSHASTR